MSIRNFKQLFSVVFALILGTILLTVGLNLRSFVGSLPHNLITDSFLSLTADTSFYYQSMVGALAILGVLFGAILGPKVAQWLVDMGNSIETMSTRDKVAVAIGTIIGVVLTLPFFLLLLKAPLFGVPGAILLGVAFVYLGIRATLSMKDEFPLIGGKTIATGPDGEEISMDHCKILDTNVIIDGRIADICKTKFIEGPIYVPGFVLDELQHIADSSDSLKRARGRRGLDILNSMQEKFPLVVRSYDYKLGPDKAGEEVDTRLVRMAKTMGGTIITNDYNLNKVAALQGVTVLNVNELANALKPVVLPGEDMNVTIIKEGKEQNQGVAYLEDGTMIVVEDGRRRIGDNLDVIVTSVLQTVAGKMIFARIKGLNGDGDDGSDGRGYRSGGGSRGKVR